MDWFLYGNGPRHERVQQQFEVQFIEKLHNTEAELKKRCLLKKARRSAYEEQKFSCETIKSKSFTITSM